MMGRGKRVWRHRKKGGVPWAAPLCCVGEGEWRKAGDDAGRKVGGQPGRRASGVTLRSQADRVVEAC